MRMTRLKGLELAIESVVVHESLEEGPFCDLGLDPGVDTIEDARNAAEESRLEGADIIHEALDIASPVAYGCAKVQHEFFGRAACVVYKEWWWVGGETLR